MAKKKVDVTMVSVDELVLQREEYAGKWEDVESAPESDAILDAYRVRVRTEPKLRIIRRRVDHVPVDMGSAAPEAAPLSIEDIARACHEANRAYCESIGDTSQVPWDEAPENIKASAIAGVNNILDNPDTTPEQSHESWLAFKEADGWVYGEVKDAEAKTHPCMVPYDKLPEAQREKDSIFLKTARAMLGMEN